MWLLNAALFFVLFAFALNNQDPITLHLFFGARWQAPLVLVVLLSVLVGVCLGVIVMLPLWLKARRARAVRPSVAGESTLQPPSSMLSGDSSMLPPDRVPPRHGS